MENELAKCAKTQTFHYNQKPVTLWEMLMCKLQAAPHLLAMEPQHEHLTADQTARCFCSWPAHTWTSQEGHRGSH